MTQTEVTVTIENLAPEQGTFLTPVWVGFHNGNFDTYDRGRPVSPGLESIAEDGDFALISQEFALSGDGSIDGAVFGPEGSASGPIDPGEVATATFVLDSEDPNSQFFNYAAMILPSNDAFIANGNPEAFRIFDEEGNFIGADFLVLGNQVLDAGTEVNDEAEESTAFLGQTVPNTGVEENGVVQIHPGFIEGGRILSSSDFANADFTTDGYQIARITITAEGIEPQPPENEPAFEPLFGSLEGDTLEVIGSNQLIFAGDSDDLIDAALGSEGNNRIYAGGGDDTLILGEGDRAVGGEGDDRFFVTSGGNNTITGGAGADQFWLASGEFPETANIITDFTSGEDVLGVAGLGIGFADVNIIQQGDDVLCKELSFFVQL